MNDRLQTIGQLLSSSGGDQAALKHRVEQEWAERKFERIYVRILDGSGKVVTETPGLAEKNQDVFNFFSRGNFEEHEDATLIRVESEKNIYQLARSRVSIGSSPEKWYVIQVALDRTSEDGLLRSFQNSLFFFIFLGALGSFWIARNTVRRALQNIQEVSLTAARINATSLKERIDPVLVPREFRELVSTINAMLDRLDDSFERLSRFSADMAHELRTPVNNLLGTLSVALSRPRETGEYENVLSSGVEECQRLRRIIESILFIARASDPSMEIARQEVRLGPELRSIISFYELSAQEAGVTLQAHMSDDVEIMVERVLFQRAIGNLLSNSIRHSEPGSTVEVRTECHDDRVLICVNDEGCGIEAAQLGRLGERFYRIDPSRTKASGGAGLGLSIVKSIVQIHHGSMSVKSAPGVGTTVTLDFPLVNPHLASAH